MKPVMIRLFILTSYDMYEQKDPEIFFSYEDAYEKMSAQYEMALENAPKYDEEDTHIDEWSAKIAIDCGMTEFAITEHSVIVPNEPCIPARKRCTVRIIKTGEDDFLVRVWDLEKREEAIELRHNSLTYLEAQKQAAKIISAHSDVSFERLPDVDKTNSDTSCSAVSKSIGKLSGEDTVLSQCFWECPRKDQFASAQVEGVTIEKTEELYRFMQGEVPECLTMRHPLRLSSSMAFSIIYYLQEVMGLLPDHYERCITPGCGELFDSNCTCGDGRHCDAHYHLGKNTD